MRIQQVELSNFKRFTHLTIQDIPASAKLVLLIGSNGSGKSSVFDGFDWLSVGTTKPELSNLRDYYPKSTTQGAAATVYTHEGEVVEKIGSHLIQGKEVLSKFIGRSSIRIVPRITNQANPSLIAEDGDAPDTYIENDTRFINDVFQYIQNINTALREPVFRGEQADTLKIFRDFIAPLNQSLLNIFGGDEITTIQISRYLEPTPSAAAKLIFKKGASEINYDLLSHGEKQVVILLINFIVRQAYYQDAILFIDEMDCHLNTSLQFALLKEIVEKWVPDNAQLWTASHALGFIEYAQKSEQAAIIDFDLYNFDLPQTLYPEPKDNMQVYEIAIPRATVANILKHYKLVVVENKNDEYYNAALGQSGYLFLPANNNREVFLTVKADKEKIGLRDRDYLRPDEIVQIQRIYPNLKILAYATFENYLYHPDNIDSLGIGKFDKSAYIADIVAQKNERIIEIAAEIALARTHYVEFKDAIKNDEKIQPILDALKSDELAVFYPYFNMKRHFHRRSLAALNLSASTLCRTPWFREAIIQSLA